MASNQTQNYGLCQWETTDQVLRTDFNADNAKIDAALAGLNSLISEIGAFRIQTGSYVGTGTNAGGPLTFQRMPLFVMVNSTADAHLLLLYQGCAYGTFILAETPGSTSQVGKTYAFWSDNTVSWAKLYGEVSDSCYMNRQNVTYRYVALVSD